MGEGGAMWHTLIRRVEDAEELGPQEGTPPGGEGLDPSPLRPGHCARLSAAFESTWNRSK